MRKKKEISCCNLLKYLLIITTAPNGESIPARLVAQNDGDYKVEWTPVSPGM